MLLAVDVGNTQTVLGLFDESKLHADWRIATLSSDTADEICIKMVKLLDLGDCHVSNISAVALASVVPVLTEQWLDAGQRLSGHAVLNVNSKLDTGLAYLYDKPAEIGADRIADSMAAISIYGAPVIVVDFGTATNIEVIDKNGAFVGGIIAPGLDISADALFQSAARLTRMMVDIPEKVIGRSTAEAVRSGLTYGEIDRIDGLIRRVFDELGYKATVVATGGLSSRVAELSRTIDVQNDKLTLEGLRLIHERNS
ncbi:MAG: type III pantothenate kinase [Coriobacteriales bacterium]|jgi:type III pantothenate kinase|nr:type III pantothenate kinase [Coriobacteriales bacterium]